MFFLNGLPEAAEAAAEAERQRQEEELRLVGGKKGGRRFLECFLLFV